MKFRVSFRVSKQCKSDEEVAVLGNIPELGNWDVNRPFVLERMDYDKWENSIYISEQKFQFKFVVVDSTKNIREWEVLENNTNRKYKVTQSVALKMTWSNRQGTSIPLKTKSKVKGVLSIVIKQPPTRTTMNEPGVFNPFQNAKNSDSEQQNDEPIMKRRQSFCTLNKKQFLQLFYQASRHKTDPERMKINMQLRLLILSKFHPMYDEFYQKMFQYACNLCSQLIWIYSIPSSSKKQIQVELQKKVQLIQLNVDISQKNPQETLRLFELKSDQMLQDKALCIVLDIELAHIKLNKSLNGLMLGGQNLNEQLIQNYLIQKPAEHFTYIAFENPQFNQFYLKNMMGKLKGMKLGEEESVKQLQQKIRFLDTVDDLEDPFPKLYQTMAKQIMGSYSNKQSNFEKLNIQKLYKSIGSCEHRLYIFDYDMLVSQSSENKTPLFKKVLELEQKQSSLIIIVSQKTKDECVKTLPELQKTRIIIIAQKGLWIKLTHQWVNTNTRHLKNIQNLKRWFKSCTDKYQGKIEYNDNQFVYRNDSSQLIKKLTGQIKNILEQQKYIRVQGKDNEIVLKWYINRNRCIDSIIQFRCMCEGSLDFILLMISSEQKSYIVHQIQRLIRNHPLLFSKNLEKYYVVEGLSFFNMITHYIEKDDLKKLKFGQ